MTKDYGSDAISPRDAKVLTALTQGKTAKAKAIMTARAERTPGPWLMTPALRVAVRDVVREIGRQHGINDNQQTIADLKSALLGFMAAWARIQHMNGYREGDGHLWAGPELTRADDKARAALARLDGGAV